ncbi:MAG: ATPase, T2SS/T4P/T4SS family [Nitrospirota bacterium]|nr:ATPase, T2SS/T4P/T4SS family [Nitrospirota bacterium]
MADTRSRVLCLEGDPVNRMLLSVQLEKRYDVLIAESIPEAENVLGLGRPDLILMDATTLASDNYAFYQNLRNNPELNTVPMIFLAEHLGEGDRERAIAAGAADVLEKPIQEAALLESVKRNIVSGQEAMEELSETKLHLLEFSQFIHYINEHIEVPPEHALQLNEARPSALYSLPTLLGIKRVDLARMIAEYLGVRFIPMVNPDAVLLGVLPTKYCEIHDVLAIADPVANPYFVLSNPFDLEVLDILFRRVGKGDGVKFGIAEPDTIRRLLNTEMFDDEDPIEITEVPVAEEPQESADLLSKSAEEAPVVRMVNKMLAEAISRGASDVHMEPRKTDVRIRYRVDGMLTDQQPLPAAARAGLVSRFKVLSGLDISERRMPQDGRTQVMFDGRQVDIRVSTLPSRHGEVVVCRILDQAASPMSLEGLGFSERALGMLYRGIESPHGIILVTGPTGSGKTTTLYSVLRSVVKPTVSVVTVEDPIEYELAEVKQVQVIPAAGLDFPAALRSILRQDPDIVMIGEMRDRETVDVALKAAMTGHQVISTLHTNDAPSTVGRLVGMGIEPYLLAGALEMICAQRLVRRLCDHCKQPVTLTDKMRERMELGPDDGTQYYAHKGCEECNDLGYKGRLAIIEILLMDEELRQCIAQGGNADELREMGLARGKMITLRESAMEKAKDGTTSLEEVLRISG